VELQKKKGSDDEDESDVSMESGDDFDRMVSSKPAAPRDKPGRRAASKVS
jgi:hypothetical protein